MCNRDSQQIDVVARVDEDGEDDKQGYDMADLMSSVRFYL